MSPGSGTRNTRAFTLVEVTLVIAIGAILLASTLWAVKSYRDGARIQAGKINLGSIKLSAAGFRMRRGASIPFGYAGLGTIAGNSVTGLNPQLLNNSGITAQTPVCIGGTPLTIQATSSNTIQFTTILTGSGQVVVRAGYAGNVDDQCNKLLSVADPTTPINGMGLSDPWLGYTSVRPSPGPAADNLPQYEPGKGFQYNQTRPGDVWGGLAYINGDVEYVLPDPNASRPPANLGFFPNDPPTNWGGAR